MFAVIVIVFSDHSIYIFLNTMRIRFSFYKPEFCCSSGLLFNQFDWLFKVMVSQFEHFIFVLLKLRYAQNV